MKTTTIKLNQRQLSMIRMCLWLGLDEFPISRKPLIRRLSKKLAKSSYRILEAEHIERQKLNNIKPS